MDNSDGLDFDFESSLSGRLLAFTTDRSTMVTLMVEDLAGNRSQAQSQINVIDRTPPKPPVIYPLELDVVARPGLEFKGRAEPHSAVEFFFEGASPVSISIVSLLKKYFLSQIEGGCDFDQESFSIDTVL